MHCITQATVDRIAQSVPYITPDSIRWEAEVLTLTTSLENRITLTNSSIKEVVAYYLPNAREIEIETPGLRTLRLTVASSVGFVLPPDAIENRYYLQRHACLEARCNAYLGLAQDLVLIQSQEGRVLATNASFAKIGLNASDLLGSRLNDSAPILAGAIQPLLSKAFQTSESPVLGEWDYPIVDGFPVRFKSRTIAYGDEAITIAERLNHPWQQ